MTTFNPLDAAQWRQWVNDFDNTARLFATQYANLQALAPYVQQRHPELLPQMQSLIARGATHQATLATLNQLRLQAANWLSTIGQNVSNAVNASMDWLTSRFQNGWRIITGLGALPNGLGLAPVVAIAGIAAAVAAIIVIANWIKESYEFTQRLNALHSLEQNGATPEQAASIVARTVGAPSGGSFFGIPVNMLLIGVALIVLGPPVLNLLTARERNN